MINKACYVCGSFEHLQYACDKKDVRPIRNNLNRVNHRKFANKLTHPHPKRGFVPQVVLTRSGKINTAGASVNTAARPVNTAGFKSIVNLPRIKSKAYKRGHSKDTRLNNRFSAHKNSIFNKKFNIVRVNDSTARDRAVGNPQQKEYKEKGVIDMGFSRYMTGNKCYLTNFEAYDGGFISFGDGKGRISGKGKIKIGNLDFDDVYFYKELNQLLLRVPRKDNIYSVDLKSVVPIGGLTCLFAKATLDESNLWATHNRRSIKKKESLTWVFLDGKGRISGKGKIKIGNLDFDDVYFYKELNQLLLRVPRKDNIYSVDLKSVVPIGGLTCLFAKATLDESNLCVMNQFCEDKGIKREYSVARTPQQNRVVERRNMTLIEAARTMALVTKPHNKTPYELIHGRPPLIDFMKPFGCHVTILNTRDNLGKFEGKADEGYFIGYSMVRNGPDWLFDIDSLKISMNYVPVVARNQTNGIAGSKENLVAGQDDKKKKLEQEYILIPICTTGLLISQGTKDSAVDAEKKALKVDKSEASDNGEKNDQVPRNEVEILFQQERQTDNINNTNSVNIVSSPVNTVGSLFVNVASQTPINVAGPSASTNAFEEHSFERFSPFKNAFSLPHVPIVTLIDDTGIFGNAYDDEVLEGEVDMNNGHTQEEGIDYDEVFSQVARIETIRLFLAYASFQDFVVYQMDVKSAVLYGRIEEEVYVCQPPGFEDPNFLDKVYKVEKALYGLHQAPRAWQDKYMAEVLKKFDFVNVKTASTPMESNKPLIKDKQAEDVDVHLYRSMIGSLMYLTTSRPDITFTVYACARFQVNPKISHLHAVERIFRYLKGQPKLGLWYPKDSAFDLEAYSDSDYAGASLDRKSTEGMLSTFWQEVNFMQCKKQTIVANSTTETEYVAAMNCYGQIDDSKRMGDAL
nr:hypothetical protein [Tanacetum cinerariifolium]